MTTVTAVDAVRFRLLAAEVASIYGQAMKRSPEVVVQRRDIVMAHVAYPGFVAAGAFDDDQRLLGFGYGYRGAPGQWWHDVVAAELGRDLARRWLRDSFELAELHVLPEHQGDGIGRALLLDVLGRARTAHAVLSTPDTESRARRLYRSHGFGDLLTGFRFPGSSEVYAVMGADL